MLLGKNWIDMREIEKLEDCYAVPPHNSELPLMGRLTLQLKIQHLDLPFDKEFQYRFYLWGQQQPIYFENIKAQLKIAASYSNVCKYFHDMEILCIHIISLLPYNQKALMKTKSQKNFKKGLMDIQKQKKIVGYVFIPLRRFFVNNLLSNFNQIFFVVDLNKKKIGETFVNLNIEMLQNQGAKYRQYLIRQGKLNAPSPIESMKHSQQQKSEKSKSKKVTIERRNKKTVSIAGGKFSDQQEQQSDHQDKDLIENQYTKKSYFTHQKLDHDLNFELQDEENNIKEQIKRNQKTVRQLQSKNNTEQQSKNSLYLHNKNNNLPQPQQHTDLSLIRQKWGSNNPTIELMKLRLDEVKYLQDQENQNKFKTKDFFAQMTEIRIYLKKLTPIVGKIMTNQFMIHYSKKSKIVSTELTLESSKDQKQSKLINHLLVLTNPNLDDLLSFQTKEAISQFKLSEIVNRTSVELRKKDTKRRAVQLKFQVLPSLAKKSQQIKKSVQNKNIIKNPQNRQLNNSPKKSPKNINKNINAAQKQNGFMQPNPTTQLQKLSMLQKQLLNKSQMLNRSQIDNNEYLQKLLSVYTLLYESQNYKFYQLIMKILSLEQKTALNNSAQQKKIVQFQYQKQKLIDKLQASLLLQEQNKALAPINLQKLLIKLFNNSFKYFFECFQGFKQINHKYQMVTNKLTKKLSSPHENILVIISKIIQHVKKYKKTQINFGLIHSKIIFQEFSSFLSKHLQKQKQSKSQQEKQVQQQQSELENVKFLVECFLKLFQRYNSELIKISEINEFVKQFYNYQKKKSVFGQALIHSINFGNLIVLLKETSKNQQENLLKINKKQNYDKLANNQFFRMFRQNADKEHLNEKSKETQSKISLFQILFNDLLTQTLHQAQSSLNFDDQANISQRIQTQVQMNDRIRTQSLRHNTQGEDLRLKTQEMVNQQKRRLNTEDQNVIELFNKKKSKQIKQEKEDEIQIQFTKREKIFKEEEQKNISIKNQESSKNQKDLNQHQYQQSISMICQQPDTKYIHFRISQINQHQYKNKILQAFYLQKKQQSQQNIQYTTNNLRLNQSVVVPNSNQKTVSIELILQNINSSRSDLSKLMEKKIILSVRNVCGIQSYSIDDQNQGKILAMIQVQIQAANQEQFLAEQWNQKNQLSNFQTKTEQITFLNIVGLYSLDKLQTNCCYRVIVEQQNQVTIKEIQFQQNQYQFLRYVNLNIGKIPLIPFRSKKSSPIIIKIFRINKNIQGNKTFKSPLKTQKQMIKFDGGQICQFSFLNQLKTNKLGVQKASKWLINDKFRLQIEIFNTIFVKQEQENIKNQKASISQIWNQKINNLLNVFECKNKAKIQNILSNKSQRYSQKQHTLQFILNIIRQQMGFRRTQLEISTLILFPEQEIVQSDKAKLLFQLFNNNVEIEENAELRKWNLNNLYEEFQIFDFQNFGIVKKINGIVFKKAVPALTVDLQNYVIFPQKSCQIIDLKLKKMTQNQANSIQLIDYFKILWDLRMICSDNYFIGKNSLNKFEIVKKQDQENNKKGKNTSQIYTKIRIQSFNNVSLNQKSCNILFYLEEPYQKLDESAHRCHNQVFQKKKYGYSNQNIFKIGVYIKQYQGYAKRELYTQRKIQDLTISIDPPSKIQNKWTQTKTLKIFNGTVNVQLEMITKEEYKAGVQTSKNNQKTFSPSDKKSQAILQEQIEIPKKKLKSSLEKQFFQYEDVQDRPEQQNNDNPAAQIQKSFQNTKNQWIKANKNLKTKFLNLSQNLNKEELQSKFNIQCSSSDEDE